mmetsp:Transcript_113878/g.221089  ORF Transcript_113878/g.221089 Transcript_113878/m.221089 type:complete len:229 (+) Transcript_113878:1251-1937(+)
MGTTRRCISRGFSQPQARKQRCNCSPIEAESCRKSVRTPERLPSSSFMSEKTSIWLPSRTMSRESSRVEEESVLRVPSDIVDKKLSSRLPFRSQDLADARMLRLLDELLRLKLLEGSLFEATLEVTLEVTLSLVVDVASSAEVSPVTTLETAPLSSQHCDREVVEDAECVMPMRCRCCSSGASELLWMPVVDEEGGEPPPCSQPTCRLSPVFCRPVACSLCKGPSMEL